MSEVGRIVGVYGRSFIRIAVPEEKLGLVSKPGTYVKVPVDDVEVYAMVISFNLLDELYRSSRIVEELEGYAEFRPSRNELVATIVGFKAGGEVQRGVPVLPRPGQRVYIVSSEELQGIMSRGRLELGRLSHDKSVSFNLDVDKLCSRHFAVLAMTGAGKSNTIAVIVANLLMHYEFPRVILIDTHSEYVPLTGLFPGKVSVTSPRGRISRMVKARYGVEPSPLEVPLWTLSFEDVANLLRLGPQATKQLRYLRDALQTLRRRKYARASVDDPIHYRVEELVKAVKSLPSRDRSYDDLLLKLESFIDDSDLYYITRPVASEEVYAAIEEEEPLKSVKAYTRIYDPLLKPGLNIVALAGLTSEAQASTVATILRAVWRLIGAGVMAGTYIPTLIVVEEAHVYAPHGAWSPAREIMEKLAKEGRKFGVALGVVSQRPRELSQTLLAQCGTLIALRTVNPEDQRHILSSVEDIAKEMVEGLSGLGVGEALVSGPSTPLPAIVQVYNFTERFGVELGGKDIAWSSAWSSAPRAVDLSPLILGEQEEEEKTGRTLEEFLG